MMSCFSYTSYLDELIPSRLGPPKQKSLQDELAFAKAKVQTGLSESWVKSDSHLFMSSIYTITGMG